MEQKLSFVGQPEGGTVGALGMKVLALAASAKDLKCSHLCSERDGQSGGVDRRGHVVVEVSCF